MARFQRPKRLDCERYQFGWPSDARVLIGGVALVMGLWVTVRFYEEGWVWKGSLAALAAGFALFPAGLADSRRKRAAQVQVERAYHEWDDLVHAFGEARRRGDDFDDLLRKRGFPDAEVRGWIQHGMLTLVDQAEALRSPAG